MDEKGNELVQHLLQHAAHLQRIQQEGQPMHDEHDDDHDHDDAAVATAKITAMCVLFMASTICGCFPFLLNRWFRWTDTHDNVRSATVVKGLLYFGGGVLLCTTFQHLVPEVTHNIESLQECHLLPELTFNLPHLLMCAGFFAMYLVEEIVHTYLRKYRKNADSAQKAFERGRSVRNSTLVRGKPPVTNGKSNGLSKEELIQDDIEYQKSGSKAVTPTAPSQIQLESDCHHHHHDMGHSHSVPITEDGIVSALRGLLIVLALSLHELFEGLAVGLESEPERVWYMFGAVSAHKLVLAFCVGVELIVNRTRMWLAIVYVVTFAIVSPLGIGIGIIVSSEDNMASAIPAAILQGLASGTLLYVVFFEILSKDRSGLINYVAFIIGFLLMFGIQFATTGSHGHSHATCDHSHGDTETRSHTHGAHDTEHVSFVASNDENLKLIKETAEELAHALATKIK